MTFEVESIEVIDLMDSTLKNEIYHDKRSKRVGATGGLINNQPIICGGFDGPCSNFYTVLGQFNNSRQMLEERRYCSSVVLNQTDLWLTGGSSGGSTANKSTELISMDQPPRKGPELPFTVSSHSMVLVDPKTIFIIGGQQNSQTSNKTWIIDPTKNFEMKSGPTLNVRRRVHSCSKLNIDGKIHVVVAGGMAENCETLHSVELLDISSPNQTWIIGKNI